MNSAAVRRGGIDVAGADVPPAMADVARWRQGAYRLVAASFLFPRPREWALAGGAARELRAGRDPVIGLAFYRRLDMFLAALESSVQEDVPVLQREYRAMFGDNARRGPIPLVESGFVEQDGASTGMVLASLETAYATGGAALSPGEGRTADHASVELEFVSFLCGREADAWVAKDIAGARRSIGLQRRFLGRHPSRWMPILSALICDRGEDLYSIVAQAALSLIAHDLDFLRVIGRALRAAPAAGGAANAD